MAGGRIFADALGSESLRISSISGVKQTMAHGGNPVVDQYNNDDTPGLVLAEFAAGLGTETVESSGNAYYTNRGPAQVMGRVNAVDVGATAEVFAKGSPGTFVNGYAVALDTGTASISADSGYSPFASHFVGGFARAQDSARAEVSVYEYGGPGAFAFGAIFAAGTFTGRIEAQKTGGFAQGVVCGPYATMIANGNIIAGEYGSHAGGYVSYSGGTIWASGSGSFARGVVEGGQTLLAGAPGAAAIGRATANPLRAQGSGSFATGDTTSGEIRANATNAQQFGVGSNAVADSAQFGVGIRLHHLAAVPGAPANGSIWSDGTNIGIHSAGANQIFNRPTVTGAKAGNAALTSLLSGLAAMGLIVDSTT
jgi:hypothetical protein